MLRFLTSGESHGQALVTILEGLPAGLTIDFDAITLELRRRQGGYGRGRRMVIESDRAEILSGVRRGRTTGAPVALLVRNKDWENWQNTMHVEAQAPAGATGANRAAVVRPRPGHADLAGALKYDHEDIRDVLERASARETAARVAAGAIARQLLQAIGCEITSHITGIGPVVLPPGAVVTFDAGPGPRARSPVAVRRHHPRAADDRRDRRRQGSRRHARRIVRSDCPQCSGRSRQLRSVGSQAGWPACAGLDVDSGHQGRVDRRRRRRRAASGLAGARRNRRGPGRGGRTRDRPAHQSRRRPRRAASPTARKCASPAS